MNKHLSTLFYVNILLMAWAIILLIEPPAYAQPPNQWSPQAQIPVYDDLVKEQPPRLISAPNGMVYAFNAQTLETDRVIMYREWTQEQGWSEPNDIFVARDSGNIEVLDVFLDHEDVVHIILAIDGSLYYSKTLLAHAYDASEWVTPLLLASQMTGPPTGGITGDDQGNLVIVYGGMAEGNGVYWLDSEDNGETWSEPNSLFLTLTEELWALGIQVYAGESGQLHAVWNTISQAGQGDAVYYANFNLQNKQWRDVFTLAEKSEDGILGLGTLTPAVIEHNGFIIASYYNGNVNGNWWRLSNDGGQTWTEPNRVSPRHVGTNGALSYATDSQNTLHAFFGQRIDDRNHGMWHINWTGFGWTEPVPVVSGPQVKDVVGGNGFDPKAAGAIINQGNQALVTWVTDGIAGENGVWFSYARLDVPELVTRSLTLPRLNSAATAPPTEQPPPTPTLIQPTESITPAQTKAAIIEKGDDGDIEATSNPSIPLVVGLAPIILIISALIAYQLYSHNANR